MKHESLSYEREWRVIDFDFNNSNGIGSSLMIPVPPSVIYFGKNCATKDIDEICALIDSNKISCTK